MARSGIGGGASIPVLLRLRFVLGTDRIAKVARLRRGAARLALPLATFRTLTLTSAATSSATPSAARLAVLAAILGGLRLSGLPRLSGLSRFSGLPGRGLALRLFLVLIASFEECGSRLGRLEL
jgi:hypothetical protein